MSSGRKRLITILAMIAILIFGSGWFVFSKYIRPNHYQLLRPYIPAFARNLASTETEITNGRVRIRIPAGKAIVGRDEWLSEVELDDFWIDQSPVTIGDYKAYVKESGALPPHYRNEYAEYYQRKLCEPLPVTYVSWKQAEDYCEYYGGHLPTEAQWEKAARGTDGTVLYWEDDGKAYSKANYDNFFNGHTYAGWLPQGATVYGVLDMMGNVREWVMDPLIRRDQPVSTFNWQDLRDLDCNENGRILKGGGYMDDLAHLRLNWRDWHEPKSPGFSRGFRCVYEGE